MRADHDRAGSGASAGAGEGSRAAQPSAASVPHERSDPWKAAFVALLVVSLVCTATWILLGSRLLVVRDVAVTGLERVSREEVVAAVGVPTGTPLIRVDLEEGADRVGTLTLVESATVSRGWPATLRVEVVERQPLLAVRVGEEYRLVDRDGVRIEDTPTPTGGHPLVRVTGEIEGSDAVRAAAEIVETAPAPLLERIRLIDATDTGAIRIEIAEGAVIEWGDTAGTGDKSDILSVLMREHPPGDGTVYDLSTPDLAIVR